MNRNIIVCLFLLTLCNASAHNYDDLLDSIYVIQCKTVPIRFHYQVEIYNQTRRIEDVKNILFKNINEDDTLTIIELYKDGYDTNYSVKWRNNMLDFSSYRFSINEESKEELLLHYNEEECIIPLELLNYLKEDEYNKIDNFAKEKEKMLHTGYYYLSCTKIIFKSNNFVLKNVWLNI